jgi:hypothetical protein
MLKLLQCIAQEDIIRAMSCPYCGVFDPDYDGPGYYVCNNCQCLYGRGTLVDSCDHIIPVLTSDPESIKRSVMFDIHCSTHNSTVVHRTGLYDPVTLMITQEGFYTNAIQNKTKLYTTHIKTPSTK